MATSSLLVEKETDDRPGHMGLGGVPKGMAWVPAAQEHLLPLWRDCEKLTPTI